MGANRLRQKYADASDVVIVEGDVSADSFSLDRRFDVINAIGVVFYIVEDDRWRQALANMRGLLEEGGVLLVGGEFGCITQNVQFHSRDEFAGLAELLEPSRWTPAGRRSRRWPTRAGQGSGQPPPLPRSWRQSRRPRTALKRSAWGRIPRAAARRGRR